jgi:catechol 2,3-dioxygenase-like lactoylglutathione lyase family enzyme
MPAQVEKTVVECPEPLVLAGFYADLLGMQVLEDRDDWVVIGREPGMRELAFQRPLTWVPPAAWPNGGATLHLDLHVDDVEEVTEWVLAHGARRAPGSPETGYRVFLDPVGHPFCLIHGRTRGSDPRWRD